MKILINKDMFLENKIIDFFKNKYRYLFYTFPERLTRAISFFKIGWLNYDFDYMALNELVLFKLKRMLYCFEKYGNHSETCVNYKPKMKSIKLTIKLLENYIKDDYTKYIDLHDKKWGKSSYELIPVDEVGNDVDKKQAKYFRMDFSKPNAVTEEQKKQERQEFLNACNADDRQKEKHLKLIYKLITKYQNHWWD